ncbi:MAG: response regulator [Burkholderiales bacterium]|nr:response regulator [Burkholderiales bacterium]
MDTAGSAPPADDTSEAARALRGRRVLLVAAEGFDRLVATELLDVGAGAQVLVADDVARALPLLQAQRVDAIVLDLDGADDGGAAIVRGLQVAAAAAGCPIVAMATSGVAPPPGAPAGILACVAKPLHPAALFGALARCMPQVDGSATAAPAAIAAAPGCISFAIGIERCLGRRDLYERIALRFLAQGGASVQGIGEALDRGDRNTAKRLAHSLISTAGTLGAMPLSDGARALYAALAEGADAAEGDVGPGGEGDRLTVLAAEAARVLEALRAHLHDEGVREAADDDTRENARADTRGPGAGGRA